MAKQNRGKIESRFRKRGRLFRILLLIIPIINWVTEILVRWSRWNRKRGLGSLLMAVLATFPTGIVLGYVDAIWTLLFNRILFGKN